MRLTLYFDQLKSARRAACMLYFQWRNINNKLDISVPFQSPGIMRPNANGLPLGKSLEHLESFLNRAKIDIAPKCF